MPLQRADVLSIYRAFHDRDPDASFIAQWTQGGDLGSLVRALRQEEPFPGHREHNGPRFLAPRERMARSVYQVPDMNELTILETPLWRSFAIRALIVCLISVSASISTLL